mmetsp:Transcript_13292/g.53312  ORF Transcript_13292/g.53312 Transcript_13292/m.53312 type:complete len:187 (+) Transcript_13292:157-717(+)
MMIRILTLVTVFAVVPVVVGFSVGPSHRMTLGTSVVATARPRSVVAHGTRNDDDERLRLEAGGAALDPSVKLLLCVAIDLVGVASFGAPGVGEVTDIAWAPISAFLIQYLFGNSALATLAFVEELLPGFDVIPTATIAWILEYVVKPSAAAAPPLENDDLDRSGRRRRPPRKDLGDDVIDVSVVDK